MDIKQLHDRARRLQRSWENVGKRFSHDRCVDIIYKDMLQRPQWYEDNPDKGYFNKYNRTIKKGG